MDIFAHGLWSVVVYKAYAVLRRVPIKIRLAAFFGVMPDILSFGLAYLEAIFTSAEIKPILTAEGSLDHGAIPQYVYYFYSITHSLIVFLVVFMVVWLWLRRPVIELGAWALHIMIDIPTHTTEFFPTPFLWPLSSFKINGTSWGTWEFLTINYFLIVTVFTLLYLWGKRKSWREPKKHK